MGSGVKGGDGEEEGGWGERGEMERRGGERRGEWGGGSSEGERGGVGGGGGREREKRGHVVPS